MAIRGCRLVAIDGPQGSGKTTLVHAMAAHLRERGTRVAVAEEATRQSTYFVEAMLHGQPPDVFMELDILGTLITTELALARHHDLVLCDRSIVNVVGYARLLLDLEIPANLRLLGGIEEFCRAYALLYDRVYYLSDKYSPAFSGDPLRGEQHGAVADDADLALRTAYLDLGVQVVEMPTGMVTPEKVTWVSQRLPAQP